MRFSRAEHLFAGGDEPGVDELLRAPFTARPAHPATRLRAARPLRFLFPRPGSSERFHKSERLALTTADDRAATDDPYG